MPVYPVEIKPGEDNPIEATPILTDDEKEIIKQKQGALDKLLSEQGIAKYKVDVQFASKYSTLKPSAGIVSFWESGKKFHGGGDCKLYICPGKDKGMNECSSFIPEISQGYGHLLCPSCQKVWKGEEVVGEVGYRLTSQGWTDVLLRWFLRLGMNADLRIKYPPDDVRSVSSREQDKQMMGDLLHPSRARRATRIYTLGSIIKDTSNGADLRSRILAFITA